jgi:hypothetical protein
MIGNTRKRRSRRRRIRGEGGGGAQDPHGMMARLW